MSATNPTPPASAASSTRFQLAQLAVTVVIILVVGSLIALDKVTASAGLPLIGTLAGLHSGIVAFNLGQPS